MLRAEPVVEVLRLAADPRTPPGRLQSMAKHADEAVRREVASNPSTPAKALLRLLAEFPAEVGANAALPLLLMVDPTLLLRASEYHRLRWILNEVGWPYVPCLDRSAWVRHERVAGRYCGVANSGAVYFIRIPNRKGGVGVHRRTRYQSIVVRPVRTTGHQSCDQ
ncbi:MAG: hypothetical protein EON48_16020 [Acetobacteraceae bacterium]|nr:MAG: hypothetical protein EON48_16020 [Acetobacteraceae bacterium]